MKGGVLPVTWQRSGNFARKASARRTSPARSRSRERLSRSVGASASDFTFYRTCIPRVGIGMRCAAARIPTKGCLFAVHYIGLGE